MSPPKLSSHPLWVVLDLPYLFSDDWDHSNDHPQTNPASLWSFMGCLAACQLPQKWLFGGLMIDIYDVYRE